MDNVLKLKINNNNMNDGYEVYGTATLAFKKLSPSDGDVIVIKFPTDIHPEQMQLFCNNLAPEIPEGVTVVGTSGGMEVENIPEDEMNKQGWFRFNADKMN